MSASLAALWLLLAAPARAAFEDSFSYPDGLLTNANPSSTRSAKWLVTRGSLFASGGQGWTGVPDAATPDATSSNGTGSSVFRALAQEPGGREATVRVSVAGFLTTGAANWDGAHIYARWLDQSNYYQFSVRRRDGRAAIKKRRNGTESTFTTPLYAVPPLGTAQNARVLLTDNSTGTVTLQLFINGALVAQAVDSSPLFGGRFGMAGENTEFRFDDFVVDGSTAAPPPPPSASTGSFYDGFAYADGLLTNSNPSSPRSSLWQATSGSLFASGGQGWTGVPDAVSPDAASSNGTGSSVFRVLARSAGGGEARARVAVAGFRGGVSSWDGAHIYARWQDQSNYYQFTVRRRDGRTGIRKRRNGTVSTLASRNYGAPALGTPQDARVLLTDNADGSVTLRLYLDGALLAQAVDASSPLTGGRFGMAGENVEFRFDDFAIGGSSASAPPPPPPAGSLPRAVVSLTFDDTYADHLLASRMLDARGFKGTFYMNSPRFGSSSLYLTLAQARDIAARGHEVGGHTLGHVDVAAASTTEARRQVCDDRAALRSLGFSAASFAYPFGAFDAEAETIARDCGYASARALGGSSETVPPADRYALRAPWSIRDTTTLAELQRLVTDAEASGRWVSLVFHRVCDGCGNAYGVTPALLGSFLDWLRARPSTTGVRTVGEVVAASYGALSAMAEAPADALPAGADPAFAFRDLYAFPNPSVRGARVTIRLQAGLADEVDLDLYDSSGRKLHSARFSAPSLVDDGNGKGAQYTYDYPWDVGGVGSGVYLYSVSARKAGEPGIRKTGKAAVIK